MRAFLRILLFTLIGPPIGLIGFALSLGLFTLATTGSMRDFAIGPGLFAPPIIIIVYTLGGVPALIDGIGASIVARWVSGWAYWGWVALLGGVVSLAGFGLAGFASLGVAEGSGPSPLLAMMGISGALAGFICATLFDGLSTLKRAR